MLAKCDFRMYKRTETLNRGKKTRTEQLKAKNVYGWMFVHEKETNRWMNVIGCSEI